MSFTKTQCLKRQSAAISSDDEDEKKKCDINKKRQSMALRALESAYVEDVDDDIKLLEEMNAPTAPVKLLSNEQIDAMQKAVDAWQPAKATVKKEEKKDAAAVKNPYSLRRHPKFYNVSAALGKLKI